MNKNKINISVLIVTFALSSYLSAFALDSNIKVSVDGSLNTKNATTSYEASDDKIKNNEEGDEKENNPKIGDEHRSTVALFVQNLLSVANREGGIGNEVRLIAQEQNDSSSTTVDAIAKVESKGKFSIFLFGTNYKNIGIIRSELAKTSNRIDKLSKLASSTSISLEDKQELDLQIESLKKDQIKLESFVNLNENKFSLFGWFIKVFSK